MTSGVQQHERAHPAPVKYVAVAMVLAAITIAEVWSIYIEALGSVLIPILLVLSVTKFALVALFYMHLKFDSRVFSVMFTGGLTLAVAVVFALMGLFKVFA